MNLTDLPSLEGIEKTYCESMLKQYSLPEIEINAGKRENTRSFGWNCGKYYFEHEWEFAFHGQQSWGIISIYWDKELIWQMNYCGYCPSMLLRLLQVSHLHAYRRGIFLGGRGPEQDDNLVFGYRYSNTLYLKHNKLQRFMGCERITCVRPRLDGSLVEGFFHYRGGLVNSSHYQIRSEQKLLENSTVYNFTPSQGANQNW